MNRAAPLGSVLGIILALVISCEPARACAMVFPKYRVRVNFVVTFKGLHGVPLEGMRVSISDLDRKPVYPYVAALEELTDKDGHAAIHGLKSGRYLMSVERGENSGGAPELEVVNSDERTSIDLVWPDNRVFEVQIVAGILLRGAIPGAPNFDKETPLARVDLSLKEVVSGRQVGRTSTDDRGGFAFSEVVPGIYALHMNWHGTPGYILLRVNAKTDDSRQSRFFINPTDCGLGGGVR